MSTTSPSLQLFSNVYQRFLNVGREPWSSGYGKRLTFQRSWVRILAPDTGWTWHFSYWIVVKIALFVWKRPKINEKEAWDGPLFFLKRFLNVRCSSTRNMNSRLPQNRSNLDQTRRNRKSKGVSTGNWSKSSISEQKQFWFFAIDNVRMQFGVSPARLG